MTQVKLVKFKLKDPQGKQIWTNWSEELKRRQEEVVATLRSEGVASEACFMSDDGQHVYYFMEAEDMEKAQKAVLENPHPIDIDHKKAREDSLELVERFKCLFHFSDRGRD